MTQPFRLVCCICDGEQSCPSGQAHSATARCGGRAHTEGLVDVSPQALMQFWISAVMRTLRQRGGQAHAEGLIDAGRQRRQQPRRQLRRLLGDITHIRSRCFRQICIESAPPAAPPPLKTRHQSRPQLSAGRKGGASVAQATWSANCNRLCKALNATLVGTKNQPLNSRYNTDVSAGAAYTCSGSTPASQRDSASAAASTSP